MKLVDKYSKKWRHLEYFHSKFCARKQDSSHLFLFLKTLLKHQKGKYQSIFVASIEEISFALSR